MTGSGVSVRLLRRSSLATLVGSIGSSTLMFLATSIVAATLNQRSFDRFALAATIVFSASAIGTLGYPTLLNREAAAQRLARPIWFDAHRSSALATFVVASALWVAYRDDLDGLGTAALAILGALAVSATSLDVSVGRGTLSVSATNVGAVIRGVTFATLAAALSVVDAPGATAAVAALATATVVGAATTTTVLIRRWTPSQIDRGLSLRVARITSLKMAPISMAILLLRRIDVFLITALATQGGAVGTFFLASRVAEILSYVPAAVNAFGSSDIASTASNRADLGASLRRQAHITTVAVLPASLVLGIGGLVLFRVVGTTTPQAGLTLSLLLLAQLISALFGPVGLIHTMTGHESTASWSSVGAIVATIVVGAPLVAAFGMVGAAIGALITTAGWNLTLWVSAYRLFGVRSGTIGLFGADPPVQSPLSRSHSQHGDHYP